VYGLFISTMHTPHSTCMCSAHAVHSTHMLYQPNYQLAWSLISAPPPPPAHTNTPVGTVWSRNAAGRSLLVRVLAQHDGQRVLLGQPVAQHT